MAGSRPDDAAAAFATTRPGSDTPDGPDTKPARWPEVGQAVDDFELRQLLGEGAFGRVFLARQVTLDRLVAIKVSLRSGHEGRTLAHLEHNNIVTVYSESSVPDRGWRILCMQYVAGTTLQQVITDQDWSLPTAGGGPSLLKSIDRLSVGATQLDPVALGEREALARADPAEAVCRIGESLAGALAHAHHQGILHRDIKPANILLSRYGRPLLVDFNVAADDRVAGSGLGGTPAYMAPEQIDSWTGGGPATAVDVRADVYSLGMSLFEALTGRPPFPPPTRAGDVLDKLDEMVEQRRAGPPSAAAVRPGISAVVDRTLRRAMAAVPADRYPTAGEFADALSGARHLHSADRRVPMPGFVRWLLVDHPALSLFLLAFLPHVIGSVINIAYNQQRIVRWMPGEQQTAFLVVAVVYNVLVYGTAAALVAAWFRPVWATRRSIRAGLPVAPEEAAVARATALRWPAVAAAMALLGWLPGGVLFPLVIHLWKGPLAPALAGHFVVSFAVSGLIALTYSVLGVQYAVVRGLYRELWADGRGARTAPANELAGLDRRLGRLQLLSGSIPLVGACLILVVGPDDRLTIGYRLLVIALIGLGMAGFWLTVLVRERLTTTLASLRATDPAA